MDNLNKKSVLAYMKSSPCLEHLPDETLELLRQVSSLKKYEKGEYLHKRGDSPTAYYGLLKGRIRASAVSQQGKALSLYIFNPGDWFGEISLLDGISRTHDAEVLDSAEVLMIPASSFEKWVLGDVESLRKVASAVCGRLRLAMQYIEESATLPLESRLASRLLQMYPNTHNVSQQELAHMLGVSRQSVSKQLVNWQDAGWISTEYNGIQVTNLSALQQIGHYETVPKAH